ncbi:MAG: response regulator [Gemmatimonadota bacterium]
MSTPHCALIVEDHPPTAEDLADILRSMDCDPTIAATRDAALVFLESHTPCVVLLDLSIPSSAQHIKGRANVGISLLADIRKRFGSPRMQTVWLPIIVVSGHANEVQEAVELMKLEADDIIQKPYSEADVVRRVGEALRKSGREQHGSCGDATVSTTVGVILEITGRSIKGRTVLTLGGRDFQLTDSELCVLLHLLLGRANGRPVALSDFGNNAQIAYKRVDRLRKVLLAAFEDPTTVIVNDGGTYALSDAIAIGKINTTWLAGRSHAEIARLSGVLASTVALI